MSETCVGCGADLGGVKRFRDRDGNYYCRSCVEKAERHRCEICGADTSGRRSYYRSDGVFFCESCFLDASGTAAAESAASPAISAAPGSPVSQPASGGGKSTTAYRVMPKGPELKPEDHGEAEVAITDHRDEAFGLGALAAICVAGAVAGMFTGSVLVALALAAILGASHYSLTRFTRDVN